MQTLFFLLFWCLVFGQSEHVSSVGVEVDGDVYTYEAEGGEEDLSGLRPVAVVIKNSRSSWVEYYWLNPEDNELVYQGKIDPRGTTATSSYAGHTFVFTPSKKGTEHEFARIVVSEEKNLYILPLEENNDNEEDKKYLQQLLDELNFVEDYKKRTGRPWLAYYPRGPPILHIWPAKYIGQTHHVTSNEFYWKCIPDNLEDPEAIKKCRDTEPISLKLEALSTEPKVFRINNALSEVEADLVMNLAKPKIKRSLAGTHGGLVSNTRTSKNTWIDRNEHVVMETLYRRAADILNISESILYPTKNVEQLQVVNYQVGQEYTSHHDFGADGHPQQRMITLLFYLNNQITPDAGGETAFPKAKNGYLKVHAGRGNAVLFYSMLEDGNADDLSLHAALPVKKGEKWIANFWVWDPHR